MIRPDVKCPSATSWAVVGGFQPVARACKLIDLAMAEREHAFSEPLRPEHLENRGRK